MISQVVAVFIYAIYLFLPGYLVLSSARIFRNRFLLSYGISISILVVTLLPFTLFGGNIYLWVGFLHVFIAFLIFIANLFFKKRALQKHVNRDVLNLESNWWPLFGFLGLLGSFSLYHLAVGPYTEIPSDFWKHLSRVGIELHSVAEGFSANWDKETVLSLSIASPVYIIHATVAHFLSASPLDLTLSATLVTGSIFLGSVYWFSFKILSSFELGVRRSVAGAILASLLTLISFGTASFSYVRYYAYFPTIFAFPLIYASTAIFLDYLDRPENRVWQLMTLAPLFLVVTCFIHLQEALLTFIMLTGIACIRYMRSLLPVTNLPQSLLKRAKVTAFFFTAVVVVIIMTCIVRDNFYAWEHTPHVIDAGIFLSFLKGFPMDNPSYRLWDTLGFFGIIVYAWYILRWKTLWKSDFLTAGMLLPLFTNLNPFYAVIFLNFGNPSGLWRTAYLIPLSLVAAALLMLTLSGSSRTKLYWNRLSGFVIAIFLVTSLLPLHFRGEYNRTSKIPSLIGGESKSGAKLWKDLIVSIEEIQDNYFIRRIVTDEVTKFALYAATRGQIYWWTQHEYFPKYKDNYKTDFLSSDFNYSLLVINKRNGYQTNNARYSNHWPADILDIARHYPKDIDQFVTRNPKYFELLWSSGDIKIYMMQSVGY
jgi:hypothetical protein